MNRKFEYGKICMTFDVACRTHDSPEFVAFVARSFLRYLSGDWGELSNEDKQQNDWALANNGRLQGKYTYLDGACVRFITESDRSRTTILMEGEYDNGS